MGFEEVYNTHFRGVYLYLLRLTGNADLAEEITSETFFKALKAIDTFRGESSLSTWLCRIAANCYYSYLRKNGKSDSLEENAAVPHSGPGPEQVTMERDEARRIKTVLHGLPEPYKEVFLWRVYGELPFQEIGELFGKTANWACVTYHRARKMISARMEEIP